MARGMDAPSLKRQPEAASLLQEHLRRFPGSPYTPDALYWLGRLAEEAGAQPLARGYYAKLSGALPAELFSRAQGARADSRSSVRGRFEKSDVLDLDSAGYADTQTRWTDSGRRGRAPGARGRSCAPSPSTLPRNSNCARATPRQASRACCSKPRNPRSRGGHYGAAIVTVRQIYPQLESQPFTDVPRDVWRVAYALPFEASIRRWSAKAGVDPMLVAGLIRQESAFEPEARSGKSAHRIDAADRADRAALARSRRKLAIRARGSPIPDYNVQARHGLLSRAWRSNLAALNRRWPRTMREKTA